MQITITGPRGGGATTLAIEIGKMLAEKGILVDFRSFNKTAEQFRHEAMSYPSPMDWTPSRVVIVEGIEPEDEQSVKRRSGKPRLEPSA